VYKKNIGKQLKIKEEGMQVKWISAGVNGVRYYEHESRLYKRSKDKYFAIRYKLDGKNRQESLGWASEGWTLEKVTAKLHELKENHKLGKGPQTLSEKREELKKNKEQEILEFNEKTRQNVTFSQAFAKYLEWTASTKSEKGIKTESGLFMNWIEPAIGSLKPAEITALKIEELKQKMINENKSAATVNYVIAVIRQTFNYLKKFDIFCGDNPACKVAKPKINNKRTRFYTKEEVETLFDALSKKSQQLHDIALLGMYCGLSRFKNI
jgi:integrase